MSGVSVVKEKLKGLLTKYEEHIKIIENLYKALETGDSEGADLLVKQQIKSLTDLKEEGKQLHMCVQKICQEHGVHEYVIEALYPLCSDVEEQEWFIDQKRKLTNYHERMKRETQYNMQLLRAKMVKPSVIVDFYRQQKEEQQKRGKQTYSRA